MNAARHIPNFITCMNLFCGCMAVVYISSNELTTASYLILVAAILDFADGLFARLLKAYSPIGKQLDSLADVVSFGLVPGYMLYQLIGYSGDIFILKNPWIVFFPFILTIFSALRLAKFNIDERQSDGFIGLPTPASTLFVISIPLILTSENGKNLLILQNPLLIIILSIVLSWLLVAEIPMFSLKFKNWIWRKNEIRFIFLGLSLILIVLFHYLSIPLIILIYITGSVGLFLTDKNNKKITA